MPMWRVVREYCVRAAISPLFASALAEDVVPSLEEMMAAGVEDEGPEKEVKGDGVSGCRNCGKGRSKKGGDLKACAKCLKIKYCGRACQRADWKRHKKECTAKE
jgi:hypothetical protein